MSSEKGYNGWSNYATWRINLEVFDGHDWSDYRFKTITDLCSYLEEYVDDVLTNFGEIKSGLALDYARSFVSDVDWADLARHYRDDNPRLIRDEEENDE